MNLLKWCLIYYIMSINFSNTYSKAVRLLDEKIYNTNVKVEGRVTKLGELECPCFQLLTDTANMKVQITIYILFIF